MLENWYTTVLELLSSERQVFLDTSREVAKDVLNNCCTHKWEFLLGKQLSPEHRKSSCC